MNCRMLPGTMLLFKRTNSIGIVYEIRKRDYEWQYNKHMVALTAGEVLSCALPILFFDINNGHIEVLEEVIGD